MFSSGNQPCVMLEKQHNTKQYNIKWLDTYDIGALNFFTGHWLKQLGILIFKQTFNTRQQRFRLTPPTARWRHSFPVASGSTTVLTQAAGGQELRARRRVKAPGARCPPRSRDGGRGLCLPPGRRRCEEEEEAPTRMFCNISHEGDVSMCLFPFLKIHFYYYLSRGHDRKTWIKKSERKVSHLETEAQIQSELLELSTRGTNWESWSERGRAGWMKTRGRNSSETQFQGNTKKHNTTKSLFAADVWYKRLRLKIESGAGWHFQGTRP